MGNIFTPRVSGKRELSLATEKLNEGKLEEALELTKHALAIIRKKGDQQEISYVNGRILEIQANLSKNQGDVTNAARAFGQSALHYSQAQKQKEMNRVTIIYVDLLLEMGREFAEMQKFDKAASNFEEASIAYKTLGLEIDSMEVKAKAYIFRAASVKNLADRKVFLLKAVDLFKQSGMDHPLVLGHAQYYTAMVEKFHDKEQAIRRLDNAIDFYKQANNDSMIVTARLLQNQLRENQ
ncbi:MAG: hypothetical protein HeimC2_43650 [Candidatus Heimdallarchaeota archaeon LC_2]|nr:MAG: hypothetical protein HeimC2_43650 [Candidatus Heimdallarchaeota archaeon LC_2]